jgi:hypothetical protein
MESGERARAAATIAMVAVASAVGIGVGYPVAGLLTDLAAVGAAGGAQLRPLVDVRLLRHRRVALANAAMLVGGIGICTCCSA